MKTHFAQTATGTRADGSTFVRIACRRDHVDATTHAVTTDMAAVTCTRCQAASGAVRRAQS